MNDPHNLARNTLQEIEQPGVGTLKLPKAPFRFSDSIVEVNGPAPSLGADNEWVLREVLGYSKEKIEQLTRAGILFSSDKDS